MLRKAFDIAALQFKQFFTAPASIIYFLLMPLLFTFVIGQTTAPGGGKLEPLRVAVANRDMGNMGGRLLAHLEANPGLVIQPVAADVALPPAAEKGIVATLVLPPELSAGLLAGENITLRLYINSSDGQQVQMVEESVRTAFAQLDGSWQTSRVAARVAADIDLLDGNNPAELERYSEAAFNAAEVKWQKPATLAGLEVVQVVRNRENAAAPGGLNQASPGMLVMFSMMAFLGAGVALIYERQEGTLSRLVVMPLRKASILVGKLLGMYVIGIVQLMILILAGAFLFKVDWGQSPAALVMVAASYALAATATGILLAALARTAPQATALVNIIVLASSALGGAWWPLEVVPRWLQIVGHVFPTAWAMDAFHDIITRGLGTQAVVPEVGVLTGFAVVFLALATWRFRYE